MATCSILTAKTGWGNRVRAVAAEINCTEHKAENRPLRYNAALGQRL